MKKILAIMLALVMALSVAGCGKNNDETKPSDTQATVNAPNTALALLEAVWGNYTEEETFPGFGGDIDNGVDNAPGSYDLKHKEALGAALKIPADQLVYIAEAATLLHVNANTFTGGVVKLTEGADAAVFAGTVRDAIQNEQWICGFPEKLMIAELGDYIVIAFGHNDAVNPFQQHLIEAYSDASLTYEEAIG